MAQVREDKKVKQPKYNTVTRPVLKDVDDGGPTLDEGSSKVNPILGDLKPRGPAVRTLVRKHRDLMGWLGSA